MNFIMHFIMISFLGFLTFLFPLSVNAIPAKTTFPILDKIVAVVNSDAIPESELNRQTQLIMVRMKHNETEMPPMAQLRKQVLEKLIIDKLQLQMAKEAKIDVNENDLSQALKELAGRDNLDLSELQKFVEEQGLSFAQFKDSVKTELLLSKLQQREIGQFINITQTDIENFLKSPAAVEHSGLEYRLSHILISVPENASFEKIKAAEKTAQDLIKKLNSGAKFSELAMSHSQGSQALQGGDLGFKTAAELPSLFAKIVPTLKVGEIQGPIQNESGFHIIKLTEQKTDASAKESLRSKAMDLLYQRKFEEQLTTWLRRLREEAEVEIYLDEAKSS